MSKSIYILPIIVIVILLIAFFKRINAYHSFTCGVQDGIRLFIEIYPAMLAMMFAISMLEESGLMDMAGSFFSNLIPSIPKDIWPMIFFRPISGNASLAILSHIFEENGPDSLAGMMASILQGSTDTTFYVITLYYSSVGISKIKNSLSIGLFADFVGISMAILLALYFFK